jgi:hypothetical protein
MLSYSLFYLINKLSKQWHFRFDVDGNFHIASIALTIFVYELVTLCKSRILPAGQYFHQPTYVPFEVLVQLSHWKCKLRLGEDLSRPRNTIPLHRFPKLDRPTHLRHAFSRKLIIHCCLVSPKYLGGRLLIKMNLTKYVHTILSSRGWACILEKNNWISLLIITYDGSRSCNGS